MNKSFRYALILFAVVALSACTFNQAIDPTSVGVISHGGQLDQNCLGPGIQTATGYFDSIEEVSGSALSFDVTDQSVATADTQLVGVDTTVQIQRQTDCASVHNLLTNWPLLLDNGQLTTVISSNVSQAIKVGTRNFTLDQLLSDRTGLAISITTDLQTVAAKFSVKVLNVSIKDITLDPAYEAKLQQKAQVTIDIEIANRNQDKVKAEQETARIEQEQRAQTLQAQLLAEQAQTEVQVEIAARQGKVTAAQNQVYLDNPAAFELARLAALQNIVGKGTVWFLPVGTDLSLILNQTDKTIVPVSPTVPNNAPTTNANPVTTTIVITP